MTARPDLVALTDEALAAVANWGLVKRALRTHDAEPPELSQSADRITARYADGVETVLPAGVSFTEASCTCGASAVCRHRIGLVIAVRARFRSGGDREAPGLPSEWTPGEFDDETLIAHLGPAAVARAQRIRRTGYQATVHRPTGTDGTVRVELAHCTVRFLVPHQLRHAHSSAADHVTGESIALAVWAVRAADVSGSERVHVGADPFVREIDHIAAARTMARAILLDGMAATTAVQLATAVRTTRSAENGSAVWIADACADLTDQMEAYLARHARHSRTRVAATIAEIEARTRLGESTDAAVAAGALGTETPGETPLRRSRLVGLGARVTGFGDSITAELFFTDSGTGAVLLMRHDWASESGERPTGHSISTRRVSGATVAALAASTIVTESAVRRANHRIRLTRGGIGRTALLTLGQDTWQKSVDVVDDYAEAHRRLSRRGPSFTRDRVVTDGVAAIQIGTVAGTDYSPAEQTLTVTVGDGHGNRARIAVEHRAHVPGALDAVVRAMSSQPTAVTGRLTVRAGALCISPFAIACDLGVVVPDLAPGAGTTPLTRATAVRADPVGDVLDGAFATLADLSHRGLRSATDATVTALRGCAARLAGIGMTSTARSVERTAAAVHDDDLDVLADAWVQAMLRILIATESR
ncbi:hypothetical protein [Rhodococcus sp. BE178]|uniref:hypothetical protein n=1 Tax=Rhodococcus sp. BE178 TaxID=2817737 RepID=UPI003D22C805